jgi:hypothetical protein
LIAAIATFFFGPLATLLTLKILAEREWGNAIIMAILHLVVISLVIIPFVGWIIAVPGWFYFIYHNYKAAAGE